MAKFENTGDKVSLKSTPTPFNPNMSMGGTMENIGDKVKLATGISQPTMSMGLSGMQNIGDKVSLDKSPTMPMGNKTAPMKTK